jgi:mycothiol synthase
MSDRTQTTEEIIEMNDAPEIAGLCFRSCQGESDFPLMYAVFTACRDVHGFADTLEGFENHYRHLNNCNPQEDVLIVEVGDQTVGFGRVTWWEETNGPLIYFSLGHVIPEWRRRGIGRAMLLWSEDRLLQIASEQVEEGLYPLDKPRFFMANEVEDSAIGFTALLQSEGYEPVTYDAIMVHDLKHIPEAPMPEGLEVRPAKPEHYRAIWDAETEAFRDHWGFSEPTENDYESWLNDPVVIQPELWKIAWDGDEIAGQVRSFINHEENRVYGRKRGWTEDISVRRPWRRRGLARSLLVQSLHAVQDAGMTEAALGVHLENPNGAPHLYESVGFRVDKHYTVYRKPMDLT